MRHDVDFVNKLAAVRGRFVSHLDEWLSKYLELQEILGTRAQGDHLGESSTRNPDTPRPSELIATLRMQTHKIAGSALTFGFSDLSELARELEGQLEAAQVSGAELTLRTVLERFISEGQWILRKQATIAADGTRTAHGETSSDPSPSAITAVVPAGEGGSARASTITVPEIGSGTAQRRIHVLVVEDDELVRDLLRSGFMEMGWRMTAATSGLDAILTLFQCSGAAAATRPDLILMDVNMPGMDGFSALERIKLSPLWRDIPIILLTRRDEEACQIRGYLGGADDYMTKPFDLAAVIQRISDTLANHVQTVLIGSSDLERGVRLSQCLRAKGVRVKLVHSSSDAWDALCEETPAVALIDTDLRGEGGMSLLSRARHHPDLERMPLLIGTPDGVTEDRVAGLEAGASDCLPVGTPCAYLGARICRLLREAKPG